MTHPQSPFQCGQCGNTSDFTNATIGANSGADCARCGARAGYNPGVVRQNGNTFTFEGPIRLDQVNFGGGTVIGRRVGGPPPGASAEPSRPDAGDVGAEVRRAAQEAARVARESAREARRAGRVARRAARGDGDASPGGVFDRPGTYTGTYAGPTVFGPGGRTVDTVNVFHGPVLVDENTTFDDGAVNVATGGFTPIQVGEVRHTPPGDRPAPPPPSAATGTHTNVRTGNATVGAQIDELHIGQVAVTPPAAGGGMAGSDVRSPEQLLAALRQFAATAAADLDSADAAASRTTAEVHLIERLAERTREIGLPPEHQAAVEKLTEPVALARRASYDAAAAADRLLRAATRAVRMAAQHMQFQGQDAAGPFYRQP